MPSEIQELKASPAQREAICFTEGTMLVLAGPGSGKTHVITQRIRYLIEEKGVCPGQILTITFTKSAALEMKNRCLKVCPTASGAVFGTFHSIFYQILRRSAEYRNYSLITQYEKRNIIKQILLADGCAGDMDSAAILSRCDELLAGISYQKNVGEISCKESPQEDESFFKMIMQKYRKECENRQLLDFDDMLLLCHKLLTENPGERARWQSHFSYLLIDEMQDVNYWQFEMARLLSAGHKNLFVVGDDDQAIYSFRGSDPFYMRKFLAEFPESRVVRLSDNFRCGDKIVELAAKCISNNTLRFEKEIKAVTEKENQACIKCFATKEEEMEFLCEEVRGNAAILLRTNTEAEYIARCLSRKRIPYQMKEKPKCFYDNPYVEDILSILRFVFQKPLRKDFYCFMNKPERGISRECIKGEMVDFKELKAVFGKRGEPGAALQRLEKDCAFLKNLDTYACITYILQGMKYREYLDGKLRGGEREKAGEIMDKLLNQSRDYASVDDFLAFVEQYKKDLAENCGREGKVQDNQNHTGENNGNGKNGNEKNGVEAVQIMTYHASKGLEFDRVFLPGINSGKVPHGHILTKEQMEEERRMFYVAMTRARNYLCISYVKGEMEGEDVVSPFVTELLQDDGCTG